MHNIYIIILVLSMFSLSCVQEGPMGPPGPRGADGNANVQSVTLNVYPSDWIISGNRVFCSFDFPEITENVANYGAVEAYHIFPGIGDMQALPFVFPEDGTIEKYWYNTGYFEITRETDTTGNYVDHHTEVITINPSNWETKDSMIYVSFSLGALTAEAVDYGIFDCYYYDHLNGKYRAMPYTWPEDNVTETFWYGENYFEIQRIGDTTAPAIPTETLNYKLVSTIDEIYLPGIPTDTLQYSIVIIEGSAY